MIQSYRPEHGRFRRPTALLLSLSLAMPLALIGCGGNKGNDIPPPVDSTASRGSGSGGGSMAPTRPGGGMAPGGGGDMAPPQRTGITTKQKVVVLAGAALLYYLYKRHQKAANGETVQYYQSKNGRIYYRDSKTHQAIWVTPAANYQVTPEEAQEMSKYQGYNGSTSGIDYGQAETGTPQPQ